MKIRPVGVELFQPYRRTDMTKLIVVFRNSENAPKMAIIAVHDSQLLICTDYLKPDTYIQFLSLRKRGAQCGSRNVLIEQTLLFQSHKGKSYQ